MRKILYVVLDGLGDLPTPELDGKTPLEAANIPNMDKLAKEGISGVVYTVGKGIAPESDIAVISILGYEAKRYYTGRGPLESYAEGLDVKDGDLAFRVNFATAGQEREILDRRVGRNLTTDEATALADEINEKVKLTSIPANFKFKNTIGHRGILVIYPENEKLCAEITNTDPAYEKEGPFGVAKEEFESIILDAKPVEGYEDNKAAIDAAALINEFTTKSRKVLEESEINKQRETQGKLKANLIVSRDAGDKLPKLPSITEKFNMNFGCFVEMPVEKGIALLTGMKIVEIPLPSKDLEKDYTIRAKAVIESINKFDGLYIHLKGPDEPAHDGDIDAKVNSIEAIDKYFFAKLLPQINLEEVIIAVTADHSTPCIKKAHTDDPVPLIISGGSLASDFTEDFSERKCKNGSIGVIQGTEIMPKLVEISKT